MRKDMTERFFEPSGKGKNLGQFPRNTKKFKKQDEDGEIEAVRGMRKVHKFANRYYCGDRSYGKDYNLLKRFLQSRIGQKWDDVYSEICASTDLRAYKDHHFREELRHTVQINCYFDEDGQLRSNDWSPHYSRFWSHFYVHPETGTLEYWEGDKINRPKVEKKVFNLDGVNYFKYDDIWYRVEMKHCGSKKGYIGYDRDAFLGTIFSFTWISFGCRDLYEMYGLSPEGKQWYCDKKQSANSREIEKLKKKYNLEEENEDS